YLAARHPRGGMDDATPANFRQFLLGGWCDTWFLEMRLVGSLVAVAVTDRLDDGLSAVYTFYDPALAERGLGSFAILKQLEPALSFVLLYLYTRYWIAESPERADSIRVRRFQVCRGGCGDALTRAITSPAGVTPTKAPGVISDSGNFLYNAPIHSSTIRF